jgi:hypothetical protein
VDSNRFSPVAESGLSREIFLKYLLDSKLPRIIHRHIEQPVDDHL